MEIVKITYDCKVYVCVSWAIERKKATKNNKN